MRGRIRLIGGLLMVTVAAMLFASPIGHALGFEPAAVTLIATLLGGLILALAIASLRCPSCGESLCWHAISKHSVGQWLNWLLDVRECPVCGYRISTDF